MSLHAELSPEAQQLLEKQKRNSTIASLAIALLSIGLVVVILGLFLMPKLVTETPTIVAYQSEAVDETEPEKKKVKNKIRRKPSAPASSAAKVLASTAPAEISIPVPDMTATESMDFGSAQDFGSDWGEGIGFGSGGGGASFFNQTVSAERVVYVIDYSLSMGGPRDQLMREEMKKSIGNLTGGVNYQMIFFAGPAWIAGDEVKLLGGRKKGEVKGAGGKTYDWVSIKGATNWKPKGDKQQPEWLEVSSKNLKESLELIEKTRLVWGTDWENPVEMALSMEPTPQVIFFMTDGQMGGRDMDAIVNNLSSQANRKGTIINTVSLMEPKTEKMMFKLADKTGGKFTIVGKDGKVRQVDDL